MLLVDPLKRITIPEVRHYVQQQQLSAIPRVLAVLRLLLLHVGIACCHCQWPGHTAYRTLASMSPPYIATQPTASSPYASAQQLPLLTHHILCCCCCCCRQVRCHPWFTEHLPRYLAVMQADTAVTSPRLDEEMIHEVGALVTKCYFVCSVTCVCNFMSAIFVDCLSCVVVRRRFDAWIMSYYTSYLG